MYPKTEQMHRLTNLVSRHSTFDNTTMKFDRDISYDIRLICTGKL